MAHAVRFAWRARIGHRDAGAWLSYSNARDDVFVHDLASGATTRVSLSSSGTQATKDALTPAISADGRFVAFYSTASNLVSGDTNNKGDIFVHDRQTGITERRSLGEAGQQPDNHADKPAISADGSVVAFESIAANLVAGDTNGTTDVFVRGVPYGAQGVSTYTYDAVDRLTQACFEPTCATDVVAYTYDPVGNRLSQTTPVGTTSYAYDAGHRLTSVIAPDTSVTAYTYDANGNQLTAGADTFSYDAANRLTGATVGGVASSYAYLGDGRRASATKAGVTTGFVWDPNFGLPQLALERDAVGATLRTTTYGLGPLSVSEAGQTSYLHADRLGSIAATSTAAGNPGWAYRYDPFGAERRAEQLDPAAPASPYRFTGQLLDPTGLYHLRARQYDPGTGRFLSTDPVAAALTDPYVSTYAYVRNNPLRWTDPSGECIVICAVVGAAVGAVVGAGTYVADTAINHRDWDWGQFAAATGSLAVGGAITGATAGLAWAVLPAAAPAASTAALRITGTVITVEGSLLGWSARTITSGLAGNRLTRDRAALQLAASVANPVFGLPPWTGWGLDFIYRNSPWYRSTQGDK